MRMILFVCSLLVVPAAARAQGTPPDEPLPQGPVHGYLQTSLAGGPTLAGSGFADPDAGNTHAQSNWQVDDDPLFGTPLLDVTNGTDLTTYTIPSVTLSNGITYYWRVRYQDNTAQWGPWSDVRRFHANTGVKLWNGSSTGNWSNGGDWSPSPPLATDDVVIPGGGLPCTLDGNVVIRRVHVTNGTLDLNGKNLIVTDDFAVNPAGTVKLGVGTLEVRGDVFIGPGAALNASPGSILLLSGASQQRLFDFNSPNTDLQVTNTIGAKVRRASCSFDAVSVAGGTLDVGKTTLNVAGNFTATGLSSIALGDGAVVNLATPGTVFSTSHIFQTTWSGPPAVIPQVTGTSFGMTLANGTGTGAAYLSGLRVSGLKSTGLQLDATLVTVEQRGVEFVNGAAGGTFLALTNATTQQLRFVKFFFDGSTQYNISTPAGFTGDCRVMLSGGAGWGETFENEGGAGVAPLGRVTWSPFYRVITVKADGSSDFTDVDGAGGALLSLSDEVPLDFPTKIIVLDPVRTDGHLINGVNPTQANPLVISGRYDPADPELDSVIDGGGTLSAGIVVSGTPDVTIEDFEIRNLAASGVGVYASSSLRVAVRDVYLHTLGAGSTGIMVESGCNNAIISDNEVNAGGAVEGIHVGAFSPLIEWNLVYGAGNYGINIHQNGPVNAVIRHNTVYVPGWALGFVDEGGPAVSGANVFNNIFVSSAGTPASGGGLLLPSGTGVFSGGRCDYNLYFVPLGGSVSSIAGTAFATLAAHQAATGLDPNSREGDPLFVNPAARQFEVRSYVGTFNPLTKLHDLVFPGEYSPAIDTGDPGFDAGPEPAPDGGRDELGWNGGELEASLSDVVPPAVTLAFPAGGEIVSGTMTFVWTTADAGPTQVTIEGSNDSGASFNLYAGPMPDLGSYAQDTTITPDGSTYRIRITAKDKAGLIGSAASAADFTVDNTPPGAPSLLAPAPGEVVATDSPLLDWTDVTDVTGVSYHVQVDDDPAFGSPDVDAPGIAGSAFMPPPLANGTYAWRVGAVDGAGLVGPWSAPSSFTVAQLPGPGPLGVVSPVPGASVHSSDVGLSWMPLAGAVSYEVVLATGPSFVGATLTPSAGSSLILTGLPDGAYFWLVQAVLSDGSTVSGSPGVFHVVTTVRRLGTMPAPSGTTAEAYRMISPPGSISLRDLSAQLEAVLGPYDPTKWRMFHWTDLGAYEEFPFPSGSPDAEVGSLSAWLLTRSPADLSFTGYDTSPLDQWVIILHPGWNQIGMPFLGYVPWADVQIWDESGTWSAADPANALIVPVAYYWDGAYVSALELGPGQGVFVKSLDVASVALGIPRPPALLAKADRSMREVATAPLPEGVPVPPMPPADREQAGASAGSGGGGGGGGCAATGAASWLVGLALAGAAAAIGRRRRGPRGGP